MFASVGYISDMSLCRRKSSYPGSLTDLHRFRKTVHGHDGSSRIVMVRKTDQRTFASFQSGQEPKLETITRETIETFRGQRTECKVTTEKKDCEEKIPEELIGAITDKVKRSTAYFSKKKDHSMDFQQDSLRAHNEYRQKHGVSSLKLNKEMCRLSQSWANTLVRKSSLEHSNNRDYGENIYCISSNDPNISITGEEPVKKWYEEMKIYRFGVEPNNLSSGHFTQVVWKDSKELGVAFAKASEKIVVVANYSPPGNIIGHFSENVLPVGGCVTENNNSVTDRLSKLNLSTKKNITNGTEGDFEDDFLASHNEYRKRHGVPPLQLDRKLCKYSEEWAKILASKNNLEHRKNSPYGENIYCMYSSDPNFTITGHTPVDIWYEEMKDHPFGREPNSLKTGHFTQVVWRTSEFLGVGVAKSRQGYIYVVANYSPAGNFVGHYTENVPALIRPQAGRTNDSHVKFEVSDFDQFAVDGLKAHNEYRRKHSVPEMTLCKKLCHHAKEWAENCARTSNMAHRPNNPYGENIFLMYSSDFSHVPSARDAVKKWYDEVKEHTFGIESFNSRTLHFTQVVWKDSTQLGIAMAKNHKGQTYVVANYNPRGNIIGQFSTNVSKSKP